MYSDPNSDSLQSTTKFLVGLDPAFQHYLDMEEMEEAEELTLHHVMHLFAEYFGRNSIHFSTKQLHDLGEWINSAVSVPGELENAVSTCFLEHTHQIKVNKLIAPYLSKLAKEKSRA